MRNDRFVDAAVLADEQKLVKIFTAAQREIIERVGKTDLTKSTDNLKMLAQIRSILQGLLTPSEGYIKKYSKEYYSSGVEEVDKALEKVGLRGSFNLIDPLVTEFLISNIDDIQNTLILDVKNTLSFSYNNIESSINTAITQVRRETAEQVRRSLIEGIAKQQILGDARKKISNEIVSKLKAEGIKALTYPSEKTKSGEVNLSLEAYAKSIARQTLINSRASGVIAESTRRGHDLLKISTHSNASPMCAPWAGKIVSVSGTDKQYPSLKDALFSGSYTPGGGILWRWCRHSLSVYIETDIEFE